MDTESAGASKLCKEGTGLMHSGKQHIPSEFIPESGLSGGLRGLFAFSGLNHFLLCVKDISFKKKSDGNRLS